MEQQQNPAATLLPALTKDLSPAQQGWLMIGDLTVKTVKDLGDKELVIQGFLLKIEERDLPTLQDCIKQAKTAAAEAKQQRLGYTNLIDAKLIAPLMLFEKRNDELIKKACELELAKRLEANKQQEQNEKLELEKQAFKTHFQNEYFRIAAEYRNELRRIISDYYVRALEKKIPVFKIDQTKADVATSIEKVEVGMPAKFTRVLIDEKTAYALFAEVAPYNKENDLKAAQTNVLEEIFANYANDFKRAKTAIKEVKAETETAIQEEEKKLEAEVATNNLLASGTTITAPQSGNTKVKTVYEYVAEDTLEWALLILQLTIKKWNSVKEKFRVKDITKLSIGQMAKALADVVNETQVMIDGFKVKEVKK